jgi:predicted transcriptional regulator
MRGIWMVRIFTIMAIISLCYGISLEDFDESEAGELNPDDGDLVQPPAEDSAEDSDTGTSESDMIPESAKEEAEQKPSEQDSNGLKGKLIGVGSGFLSFILVGSIFFEFFKITVLMALLTPLLAKRESKDERTKGRLLGYVEANAGIHFSALRDALKLANGVTAYHLQTLESEGVIISWRDGKLRRYAASNLSLEEINSISNPIVGTRLAILQVLSEAGSLGLENKEIRKKLDISRQLLSHHTSKLSNNQLIEKSGSKKRSPWILTNPGLEVLNTNLTNLS